MEQRLFVIMRPGASAACNALVFNRVWGSVSLALATPHQRLIHTLEANQATGRSYRGNQMQEEDHKYPIRRKEGIIGSQSDARWESYQGKQTQRRIFSGNQKPLIIRVLICLRNFCDENLSTIYWWICNTPRLHQIRAISDTVQVRFRYPLQHPQSLKTFWV